MRECGWRQRVLNSDLYPDCSTYHIYRMIHQSEPSRMESAKFSLAYKEIPEINIRNNIVIRMSACLFIIFYLLLSKDDIRKYISWERLFLFLRFVVYPKS